MAESNCFCLTLSALTGAAHQVSSSPQVIIDWNNQVFTACASETVPLPQQRCSRALSMVHLAQHDAVNSVEPHYRRYAYHGRVNHAASPAAAAAYAAHDVLADRFPSQTASFDALLASSISGISVKQLGRGKLIGQAAAHAIIALRAKDGFDAVVTYTASGLVGRYAFTPGITVVTARELEFVTPFALDEKDQFRAPGPYALDSAEYAADLNEVKAIGSLTSTLRTADQTDAANFWFEATPIGWNRIARTVVADQSVNLYEAARAFALLNVAMNDGWIAGWDTKFHYDFWRPITAIQHAELDGNPDTEPDASWAPMRLTPGVPEYISTHSALGEAAAVVLTETLGPTAFAMTSTTALPAGSTRSFADFYSASFENTQSRVWVGVHFRKACEDGRTMGHEIGESVADLLPRRD
ncbi:MAG: vanadium-dependent haloperoxidase [Deltaproteobacteria bacterium]